MDDSNKYLRNVDPDEILFPIDYQPPAVEAPVPASRARQHCELSEQLVLDLRSAENNATYYDTLVPGLLLKTKSHGAQQYRYRLAKGHDTFIGQARHISLKEARVRANRLLAEKINFNRNQHCGSRYESDDAQDPLMEVAQSGIDTSQTVNDLYRQYVDFGMSGLTADWRKQVRSFFITHILPHVGSKPLNELSTEWLAQHLDTIAYEVSEQHAARYRRILSTLFGWAEKTNRIPLNVVRGTRRIPADGMPLEMRVDDLVSAFRHADYLERPWRQVIQLHVLTALPIRQILNLEIHQVEVGSAILELTSDCDGPALPLSGVCLQTFQQAIGHRDSGWLFQSPSDPDRPLPVNNRLIRAFKDYLSAGYGVRFSPNLMRLSAKCALVYAGEDAEVVDAGFRGRLEVWRAPERRHLHPVTLWSEVLMRELRPAPCTPDTPPRVHGEASDEVDL